MNKVSINAVVCLWIPYTIMLCLSLHWCCVSLLMNVDFWWETRPSPHPQIHILIFRRVWIFLDFCHSIHILEFKFPKNPVRICIGVACNLRMKVGKPASSLYWVFLYKHVITHLFRFSIKLYSFFHNRPCKYFVGLILGHFILFLLLNIVGFFFNLYTNVLSVCIFFDYSSMKSFFF
jgi:hypothetical protein